MTATSIDNSVGNLDGYSVFVLEGSNTPRVRQKNRVERILDKASDLMNLNQEQNNINDENTEQATMNNVNHIFDDKGCVVYNFKTSDYQAYSRGQIFERGNKKIGVLSIDQETLTNGLNGKLVQIKAENPSSTEELKTSKSVKTPTPIMKDLQEKIDNLRHNNYADIIVVTAPNQSVLDLISKVDCVICKTVDDDVPDEGKSINDTYVMREAEAGKIQAILASPAKMLQGSVFTKVKN